MLCSRWGCHDQINLLQNGLVHPFPHYHYYFPLRLAKASCSLPDHLAKWGSSLAVKFVLRHSEAPHWHLHCAPPLWLSSRFVEPTTTPELMWALFHLRSVQQYIKDMAGKIMCSFLAWSWPMEVHLRMQCIIFCYLIVACLSCSFVISTPLTCLRLFHGTYTLDLGTLTRTCAQYIIWGQGKTQEMLEVGRER